MKIISRSLGETEKFTQDFLEKIKPNGSHATVIGLHGDLGSGKTAFVKLVAKNLGIPENITSPTFVIIKNYKLSTINYKLLVHIDSYRLEKSEELAKLGFSDLLNDPNNLIFLEWPERVVEILPPDYLRIDFKFIDETAREISADFLI